MAEYIDREALIAWLKRIPLIDLSDGRGLCRVIMEDDFKKAIKKMPKGIVADVAPVRHGRWIPVTDRFPEHGDVVLCFMKFGEQRILQWDNVSSLWLGYGHGDDWQKADVTNWMPLPEPAK